MDYYYYCVPISFQLSHPNTLGCIWVHDLCNGQTEFHWYNVQDRCGCCRHPIVLQHSALLVPKKATWIEDHSTNFTHGDQFTHPVSSLHTLWLWRKIPEGWNLSNPWWCHQGYLGMGLEMTDKKPVLHPGTLSLWDTVIYQAEEA